MSYKPKVLPVSDGGTGQNTLTNHGVIVGAGTSAITQLSAGSAGQVLQSGGGSADPAYSTATYPSTAGSAKSYLVSDGTNFTSFLKPLVVAYDSGSSSSTGDGTTYTIPFGNVVLNQGSVFSSGTFTSPATAEYLFVLNVAFTSLGASHTWGLIYVNGNPWLGYGAQGNYAAMRRSDNNVFTASYSVIKNIGSGGTVIFQAQVGGSTKTVGIQAADTTNYTTTINIYRVS